MTSSPLDIADDLRALVGQGSVRSASPLDAVFGRQPRLILEPANAAELAAVLRLANEAGLAVVPRGGGTKLSWGNPPVRADIVLSTIRLNKIIEHVWADLTVSVEAGCTVAKLQAALAQHGQRLAVDPLWPETATIGGILSANDSGALRLRFGALRDLILGVTIALPDGTVASSGGKVVKNVAGYDLPKLVTGALGTLGVITRAVFRLHPLPHDTKTISISPANLAAAQQIVFVVQDSNLAHTSLQLRVAHDAAPVVDVLFEGTLDGIAGQVEQLRSLAASATNEDGSPATWSACRSLWESSESAVVAKVTSLPASIAETIEQVRRIAAPHSAEWRLVMQGTGVGSLRLDGAPKNLHGCLTALRAEFERAGGSLGLHHVPATMPSLDAWGTPGDALPLMRAIKKQFDARCTLNPGRFVGGI
jgi:glycolate oxidase FAD binding subunit